MRGGYKRRFCIFLIFLILGTGGCSLFTKTTKEEEQKPVFTNVEDIYAVRGRWIDYRESIRAFDMKGRELTEEIRVDASRVIQDECGAYTVYFQVEDEEGRRAEAERKVYIVEGEAAVELFLEDYEPAFVHLRRKVGEEEIWGSGFIMEVEEEAVYLMTNAHVAGQKEAEVFFYEGSRAIGQVIERKEEPDMAVLRVDLTGTEEAFRQGLIAVDADMDYWKGMDPEDLPAVGYRCKNEKGEVWAQQTGRLGEKENRVWALDYPVLSYTAKNLPGASGSAIIDESGKLIAMALGVSKEGEEEISWGVRLPELFSFYSQIPK